jgi:hypothetical protein
MLTRITAFVVLTLFLPLLGAAVSGTSLSLRFQYPPVSRHSLFAPFSAPVFATYLVLLSVPVALLVWSVCCRRHRAHSARPPRPASGYLPKWTWAGLAIAAAGIGVGLGGAVSAAVFLLLSGLALAVDGLNCRRGATLVGQRPAYFLFLFGLGALLWWLLEYLNRFAEVWFFAPLSDSALHYALGSTLAFAPVPAAAMTLQSWLNGYLADTALRRGRPLPAAGRQASALMLMFLSILGLMAGGLWAPLVGLAWLAPVLLASALQQLWGRETFFCGMFQGNWSRILASAIAGIAVGTVIAAANALFDGSWGMAPPLLQCCQLLGVPLIGYAGFALLGILCVQLSDWLTGLLPGRARQAPQKRKPFPIPVRVE